MNRKNGIRAFLSKKIELAKIYFTLYHNEHKNDLSLCFLLLCDIAQKNFNFAKIIMKDLIQDKEKQPKEYLDYLLDFLLKYEDNRFSSELECISYDDFMYILDNQKTGKKEKIIDIINSSRIVISSKKELANFLNELIKAKLYDIALIYCEQTYFHFLGDDYFVNIVRDLMKRLRNDNKV